MNQRPTSVTIFGILNLGFGAIGLFGLSFMVFLSFAPPNPDFPNPALDLWQGNGPFAIYLKSMLVLGVIATHLRSTDRPR